MMRLDNPSLERLLGGVSPVGDGRGPAPHTPGGSALKRRVLAGLMVVMLVGLVSLAQSG